MKYRLRKTLKNVGIKTTSIQLLMGFRLYARKEFYIYRSGKNAYHTSTAATTMFQFIKKGGSFDISKNQTEHIK